MGKGKPRGKDKATEKPKSEKSEGSNCFHGKEKQVHQIQGEAGTASSSSSQSTLTATDVGTEEIRRRNETALFGRVRCSDQSALRGQRSQLWLLTQGLMCMCVLQVMPRTRL